MTNKSQPNKKYTNLILHINKQVHRPHPPPHPPPNSLSLNYRIKESNYQFRVKNTEFGIPYLRYIDL